MSRYLLLQGELRDAESAAVSVHDGGFLHGAGLFETMRAYQGRPFRYGEHVSRMLASAKALDLPITPDALPNFDAACGLVAANELADARLRLTVTTGRLRAEDGDAPPALTVLMTAGALAPYPSDYYEKGVTVMISPYRQNRHDPLGGHKTTTYFGRLLALREAQRSQCVEALWFTTDNVLAEGCVSNVFVVRGGVVKTPPPDTPVLPGIIRGVVLDLARRSGIEAVETPLTIDDLLDADEVFLTNSGFEIVPVVRVERRAIGPEKPGSTTIRLLDNLRAEIEAETHHRPVS